MNFFLDKTSLGLLSIGIVCLALMSCQTTGYQLSQSQNIAQNTSSSEIAKQQTIDRLYQKLAREFPEVSEMSVSQLRQHQQTQKIVLVDVRPPEERAVSIIPGAISTTELEANLDFYQKYPIVVYCTIGYRSGKYVQKLAEKQQNLELYNLKGSLLAWSHIKGELVNDSGNTNQVHVYSPKWQLVADDYQAVW